MPLRGALTFLGPWSLIGASLFSAFVVVVFRSGLAYAACREDEDRRGGAERRYAAEVKHDGSLQA